MATAKESTPTPAEAEKNGSGGGSRIATLDDFNSIQREEKVVEIPGRDFAVKIRGLSVAQLDAINAELGEGISEFRLMASIAAEGLVEPEIEIDTLLGMPPSVVLLIGGEVASLSGMSESAVSAVEKSVREG